MRERTNITSKYNLDSWISADLTDDSEVKAIVVHMMPYNAEELCRFYKISRKTFYRWMKKINYKVGERCGHYYSVKQVEVIFSHYGLPYDFKLR